MDKGIFGGVKKVRVPWYLHVPPLPPSLVFCVKYSLFYQWLIKEFDWSSLVGSSSNHTFSVYKIGKSRSCLRDLNLFHSNRYNVFTPKCQFVIDVIDVVVIVVVVIIIII